jgi:hypothetical protein
LPSKERIVGLGVIEDYDKGGVAPPPAHQQNQVDFSEKT